MIYAYDNNLFYKAQQSLAWMFDYGILGCGLELDDFYNRFLNSDISKRFERGDSTVVAGMSGIEMAMRVISDTDDSVDLPEPVFHMKRSEEYWLGWVLAYYQWIKNIPFKKITANVEIADIASMYKKYHEMDVSHFVDRLDDMRAENKKEITLKVLRGYAGLSQNELAKITDIPVKTIQAYEQGAKNINNASVDYVLRISKALNCNLELLLEK